MNVDETTIEVSHPIDITFRFVADPRNDPLWHTTVAEVRMLGSDEIGPGAAFVGTYDSHRRTLAAPVQASNLQPIEGVLVDYAPPSRSRLRVRFVAPPRGFGARVLGRSFELAFQFEPSPSGTRITRTVLIEPVWLVRPLMPLFAWLNRGRSAYLLELLRDALDAQLGAAG